MSTIISTGSTSAARTTSATTTAPSTTMMAILDKYASLNRHIDEARDETLHIQDRIDQIHSQLEDIQRDREQMNLDIQQARIDSQNLHQECQQHQKEADPLRPDPPLLDNTLATIIRDHQRDFLHQSRQFRQTLRRLRLTATDLGLDRAPSHAWLELKGALLTMDDDNDDESNNDERENDEITNTILVQHWHEEALAFNLSSSNLRQDTASNHDFEMEQVLEAYNKAWTKDGTTKVYLNTMVLTHEEAKTRSKARKARQEQLRAQLDRLCRDTTTLEEQLRDLRQETHIVQGMEESFRQRAATNAAAVVRRPQNPYNSPAVVAAAGTTTTTGLPQRPIMVTVDRQEQYSLPANQHQARRRYIDRQFQTTVGVTMNSTMDDDSDDGILSFAPFQK